MHEDYDDFILFKGIDAHERGNAIALTNNEDAIIRKVSIKKEYTVKNEEVIKNILTKNGLGNVPVVIKRIFQVDLDGDGVKEEIIEADNLEKYNEIKAKIKKYKVI